jgi:hypothetical protein
MTAAAATVNPRTDSETISTIRAVLLIPLAPYRECTSVPFVPIALHCLRDGRAVVGPIPRCDSDDVVAFFLQR